MLSLNVRFSMMVTLLVVLCTTSATKGSVLVVGSTNADIIVPVSRFPEDGENIVAEETAESGRTYAGGKGAIQAVACAKLVKHTPIKFVTQFGCDPNGKMLKETLVENGVDIRLSMDNNKPSGMGVVFLKETGSVSAIVVGAANAHWPKDLDVTSFFSENDVSAVMLQMEVPQVINEAVAKEAMKRGIFVFQDIGGAERALGDLEAHLRRCDVVSPNESELKRLTGMPVSTEEEVIQACSYLQRRGAKDILVTLGSKGSLYLSEGGTLIKQRCFDVDTVVDETGAGDNFRAAFVVKHVCEGRTIKESLEYAAASASLAVGKTGGIPSCTTASECQEYMSTVLGIRGGQSDSTSSSSSNIAFPLKFASRLNSMKDREAVLGLPSSGVGGWVRQQGAIQGLDYVDFNYPQHFRGSLSEQEKDELGAFLEEAGLKCGAVCLRYPRTMQLGALTNPDPTLRGAAIQLTKEACEWSLALGAGEVVVWSAFDGYDYSLQVDYDVLWDRVVTAFREVCDAYPMVKISLEYKPTDENTRFFAIPSAAAAILLVKEVDRNNFGLTLDFGHCLMAGENPAQAVAMVEKLGGRGKLFGVQLGDGYGRLGAEDGLAFGSVHPWAALEFVLWLQKTNFKGHIYFDTFPRNEPPVRECEYNIRSFKRCWAQAEELLARKGEDIGLSELQAQHDAMGILELLEGSERRKR